MGLGYCFLLTWSLFIVAFNHADLDDSMSARMILSGIQSEDEAHLQYQLALMTKEERKGFKQGRISIDECYYLMGTTDPTGTLKRDQVCVILYASNIHHMLWIEWSSIHIFLMPPWFCLGIRILEIKSLCDNPFLLYLELLAHFTICFSRNMTMWKILNFFDPKLNYDTNFGIYFLVWRF